MSCELEAGGDAFFCFGTPHAIGDNTSAKPRAGVGIHFVNEDKAEGYVSTRWQQIRISGNDASEGQREYGSRVDFVAEVNRVLEAQH